LSVGKGDSERHGDVLGLFSLNSDRILLYVARILVLLIAIPAHESAHAWVSYKLGDPTAKNLGRISLNPAKHFDLTGTLCLLLLGFGWAKPVPINTQYYQNKKAGMALSSFAGPLSNFIMAFFFMVLLKVFYFLYIVNPQSDFYYIMHQVLFFMVFINIILALFNMIPVPPLDGSRIFLLFLPERIYFGVMRFERYTMVVIFALLWTGLLDRPLAIMQDWLFRFLGSATLFVDIAMRFLLTSGSSI